MRKGMKSHDLHVRGAFALLLPAAMVAILISSCPLAAQFMTKQVNLVYLTRRADVIVQGKVKEVVNESLPGYPNIPTVKVTLTVEIMLRGPQGTEYTFREILLGSRPAVGKKQYSVGENLLLFLPSASNLGLSSPIAMEQGRFHLIPNAKGKWTAVNEYNNAGLFSNVVKEAGSAGQKLTPAQVQIASTKIGAVQLDGFVSLVKSLTSMPRIQ